MTSIALASGALLAVIALAFAYIKRQISIQKQLSVDTATREERLKPIDAAAAEVKTEVQTYDEKIQEYNHDAGTDVIKPVGLSVVTDASNSGSDPTGK